MTRIHRSPKVWLGVASLALLAGVAITQVRPATRPAGIRKAPADGFVKKTYTYKTVGELKIQADVHCAPAEKPRPARLGPAGSMTTSGVLRLPVRLEPGEALLWGSWPWE